MVQLLREGLKKGRDEFFGVLDLHLGCLSELKGFQEKGVGELEVVLLGQIEEVENESEIMEEDVFLCEEKAEILDIAIELNEFKEEVFSLVLGIADDKQPDKLVAFLDGINLLDTGFSQGLTLLGS